jgi:radical SAM superfamily enzyme YgiQ (UPF0313 family)
MFGIPGETKEEILDTVKMIRDIQPDVCSPTFFTPHPGSDLYNYCKEHDLSLIRDHNYRRNPTEPKIKGHDYTFLEYAVEKSKEPLYNKVIDRLERELSLSLDKAEIYRKLGILYYRKSKISKNDAVFNWKSSLELKPKQPDIERLLRGIQKERVFKQKI